MECFKVENLSFAYPKSQGKALKNINLTVNMGEFVTLCGQSGCGKTTLLRLLKTSLAPYGNLEGDIYFGGRELSQVDPKEQAGEIGFVMQSPETQIVTDKVWHEMAFGLESLGYSTFEIRTRVAEMAAFFGIETWFHKKTTELSGGQKQLLNLASVMAMQPKVLILDEPTSQLDPISAQEFLKTLEKINLELGTTIILSEHRLEDAFTVSDRVVVMDEGRIIADSAPRDVGNILMSQKHPMHMALPTPIRIYGAVENGALCPVSVRDGRKWLEKYSKEHILNKDFVPKSKGESLSDNVAVEIKDVYFRYEKDEPDVIKGLNVKINKGEIFAIMGGNGVGKSTILSLVSGINKPYRGEITINEKEVSKTGNLYNGVLGMLPQNPQSVFVKKTVFLDLLDILSEQKLNGEDKELRVKNVAALCRIDELLERHPYDLSGGEQQRAALAKVLLLSPRILLLDEPTKGLDTHFKQRFAEILNKLRGDGVTIIMVSHDIEFCAKFADRCALMFDGSLISVGTPREFFAGKSFYTTAASRMARTVLPNCIVAEDVILACGGEIKEIKNITDIAFFNRYNVAIAKEERPTKKQKKSKLTPLRLFVGTLFALLFVFTMAVFLADIDVIQSIKIARLNPVPLQFISIAAITAALLCFFPKNKSGEDNVKKAYPKEKLTKRTAFFAAIILLAIPLTIYTGVYVLEDKRYYLISLLIIAEAMIPFFSAFESKKPQAREIVIISVMCAMAVAGRTAFYMLPQFKPMVALIIIAAACLGGEAGFLIGVITGFASNFFFGQGSWTPWQMFALGMIGFVAGIIFKKGYLPKKRMVLCVYGFLSTLGIYGGIMNLLYIVQSQISPTFDMIVSAYLAGLPYDLIHAASTGFFLWFIAEPMIEKIERIKTKFGLIEK